MLQFPERMGRLLFLLVVVAFAGSAPNCGDSEVAEPRSEAVKEREGHNRTQGENSNPETSNGPKRSAKFHKNYEKAYEAALIACGLKRLAQEFRSLPPAMRAAVARTYDASRLEACLEEAKKRQAD